MPERQACRIRRSVSATAATAALLAAAGLLGCESSGGKAPQPSGQAPPASAMQHPVLANIPLPAGFQLVGERSVARNVGTLRVGQCEFMGTGAPDDVARFYEKHMPSAKFALKEKGFHNGEWALRFESDGEACNIRIRPAKSKTALAIDVGPLSRAGLESTARPLPPQP